METFDNVAIRLADLPNVEWDETESPAHSWKCEFAPYLVIDPICISFCDETDAYLNIMLTGCRFTAAVTNTIDRHFPLIVLDANKASHHVFDTLRYLRLLDVTQNVNGA